MDCKPGIYESKPDAEYAVTFKLEDDGAYELSYGEGLVTTYSGKGDLAKGETKSRLNYVITGLRIDSIDENLIKISADWILPAGNDTEQYVLYRQIKTD
jgi:hypothetical protein